MIAGSDPNGKTFTGYISNDERTEVSWRCKHKHRRRDLAVACAQAQIEKREKRG